MGIPNLLARAVGLASDTAPEKKQRTGEWDPFTRAEFLSDEVRTLRFGIAVAAKREEWTRFLAPFEDKTHRDYPQMPNICVPDSRMLSSPLHLAAQCGAPAEVVQKLIALGAWRTLQNGHGERPVDVAARAGHRHLLWILEPEYRIRLPWGVLRKIEIELHAAMRDYIERNFKPDPIERHALRLPQVEPVLETANTALCMQMPWIPGAFNFSLEDETENPKLVLYANCRVSSGMDAKYEITVTGYERVKWA